MKKISINSIVRLFSIYIAIIIAIYFRFLSDIIAMYKNEKFKSFI